MSIKKKDNGLTTLHGGASCNLCGHENATIPSIFIVLGVYVPVNNIKVFSVAVEIQQSVSFALLPSYKVFCIAVNSHKY
jgi:hypothetical protein